LADLVKIWRILKNYHFAKLMVAEYHLAELMVTETANEHKREVETESRRPVESNPLFTTDRHAIQRADIHIGRRVHNGG
jgi:hypothetical protein